MAFPKTQAEWPSRAPGTVPEILGVHHRWVSATHRLGFSHTATENQSDGRRGFLSAAAGRKRAPLTDVEGVQHVAGPLRVVAPPPQVDGVVQQHGRVAVAHVGHLAGALVTPRPHRGQLHPAQRHWGGQTGQGGQGGCTRPPFFFNDFLVKCSPETAALIN